MASLKRCSSICRHKWAGFRDLSRRWSTPAPWRSPPPLSLSTFLCPCVYDMSLPPSLCPSLCASTHSPHTALRSSSHSPRLGPTNLARGSLDGWGSGASTQTGKQGPSGGVTVIYEQVVIRALRVKEKEVQQDPVLGTRCWAVKQRGQTQM